MRKNLSRSIIVFILFLNLSFSKLSIGQDWSRIWCFGDSAGIDFSDLSIPVSSFSYMDCAESCTSIGDSVHGLLMYAHTDYWPLWITGNLRTTVIHNKYHSLMKNGDTLVGDAFQNGLVIIPKPKNDTLFYLFQCGFRPDAGLYYSEINPYYNSDSGIVFRKNIKLHLDNDSIQFGIILIKHGNGRDWWVIVRNWDHMNRFNVFLVSPDTIQGPIEQDIGTITFTDIALMSVSKQGDRISLANYNGLIETYSFDRCSGQLSNVITLSSPPSFHFIGSEFSQNGRYLYVSVTDNIFGDSLRLYQYDLQNANPAGTKQTIYIMNVPASGGNLRRGPDDKIYFSCLYELGWPYPDSCRNVFNENLSVINSPDSFGLACNFTPFSFYLGGKRTYWSLPNNPNFLLGPLTGSVCDSLFPHVENLSKKSPITIFPNPTTGKVNVIYNDRDNLSYKLFNSSLQLVQKGVIKNNFTLLDLSNCDNGVYFLRINEKEGYRIMLMK